MKAINQELAKHQVVERIVLDQYASAKKFNEYLKHLKIAENPQIEFFEKADSLFISVSLASIFARHQMLVEVAKIEKITKTKIVLGAGPQAVTAAGLMLKQNNLTTLKKYSKNHFKNIQHLLN